MPILCHTICLFISKIRTQHVMLHNVAYGDDEGVSLLGQNSLVHSAKTPEISQQYTAHHITSQPPLSGFFYLIIPLCLVKLISSEHGIFWIDWLTKGLHRFWKIRLLIGYGLMVLQVAKNTHINMHPHPPHQTQKTNYNKLKHLSTTWWERKRLFFSTSQRKQASVLLF